MTDPFNLPEVIAALIEYADGYRTSTKFERKIDQLTVEEQREHFRFTLEEIEEIRIALQVPDDVVGQGGVRATTAFESFLHPAGLAPKHPTP